MALYRNTIDSPIGEITITVSESQVKSLTLEDLPPLEENSDPPSLYFEVERQLREYFEGSRKEFDLPVDLDGDCTPFQKEVLKVMTRIPYGSALTYSELAREAGNPRAIRAAASVCPKNPVFIVVPCHRVVRKDGSIGNYAFGSEIKKWLLQHEGYLESEDQ